MVSKKSDLQSLENELGDFPDLAKIYFNEYVLNSRSVSRDGLYFSLFNKIFDPTETKVPHYLLGRFELFKGQDQFYRIKTRSEKKMINNEKVYLLFNLDPLESPLELVADFLRQFKETHLKSLTGVQLLAHYHYNLNLGNLEDQKYLTEFFQLIQKILGEIPVQRSLVDLEKKSSFEHCWVAEAGTEWSCLDNYLVHLLLSKGGQYLQPEYDDTQFEELSEEILSPNHSLVFLKKRHPNVFEIPCPFLGDLKGRDFFKHPEDLKLFYYLMYENIYISRKT